eukprot:5545691-Alexandrium_andersonii.AAC.2
MVSAVGNEARRRAPASPAPGPAPQPQMPDVERTQQRRARPPQCLGRRIGGRGLPSPRRHREQGRQDERAAPCRPSPRHQDEWKAPQLRVRRRRANRR